MELRERLAIAGRIIDPEKRAAALERIKEKHTMTTRYTVTQVAKRLKVNKSTISRHAQRIGDTLTDLAREHRLFTEADIERLKSSLQKSQAGNPNARNDLGQFQKS